MAKQISIEEALDLVEFDYNPLTESWRVTKVKSNSTVEVLGDCWSVEGIVRYTINGRNWEFRETPKQKLERLIKERASHEELLDAFNKLENS